MNVVVSRKTLHMPGAVVLACGDGVITNNGVAERFPPTPFRFLAAVISRRGGIVSWAELLESLYGDRDDGGPEYTRGLLSVLQARHGEELRRLGVRVVSVSGRGKYAELMEPPK